MKLYLVKITCVGEVRWEVRHDVGSCDAIIHALDRYPQACAVSARPIGGAA